MVHSPQQRKTLEEQTVASDQITQAKGETSASPLGTTLLQLPRQYFRAVFKPSVATYSQANSQASWGLVWIQLFVWAILDAALGVLVNLLSPPATGTSFARFLAFATSYGLVLVVPTLFFLLMGIVYGFARYFGGQGTFLQQCYTSLVLQAPLGIFSKLLALIPGIGRILNSALSIYGIVLQVIVIMAVHRLSRGKAIAAILIPLAMLGALAGIVFLLIRK